jgi:hypothetical protein
MAPLIFRGAIAVVIIISGTVFARRRRAERREAQ